MLRFLMLVAVVLGVAAMHTLGHSSGAGQHGCVAPGADHGPVMAVAGPIAVAPAHPEEGHGPPHLDPLAVCLAVLGALVVVVLALTVVGRCPLNLRNSGIGGLVARLGRAPPDATIGLRIADLAVLRT